MPPFHLFRVGLCATLLAFSVATHAAELSLSGTVLGTDGKPLSGVTVSLALAKTSTTTDAAGLWSLTGASVGIQSRQFVPSGASRLVVQDGRLSVRFGGRDISGRGIVRTGTSSIPLAKAARAADVPDTLLYSWNGKVRLRDTVSASRTGIVRILDSHGMKLIPAGTFTMGSSTTEVGRTSDETQHSVTLSAFYMDSTDVTQGQYQTVMGVNPSYFTSCGTCPVENVTWFDAVLYCNARSKAAGLDTVYSYAGMTGTYGNGVSALAGITATLSKNGYRLPTEAQWEYAARGGTTTAYYWGDDTATATVSKYAWFWSNRSSATHPVATKLPNVYGLYDIAGNVWQWTNDWYGAYPTITETDPQGASSGSYRVTRGGGWYNDASILRSAYRSYFSRDPYYRSYGIGFRVVRPAP